MTRHIRFGCGWAVIAWMLGIPLVGLLAWIGVEWGQLIVATVKYIPSLVGYKISDSQVITFVVAFPICIFIVGFVVSLWTQRRSS